MLTVPYRLLYPSILLFMGFGVYSLSNSPFDVLLMAQALERAGDHTTNLAEDLYSLIEGRSLRHVPKKRAAP